jgi:ubiquinone/menaquinone biosynthesis C-methylase UbiE
MNVIKQCLCCRNSDLFVVLDLGRQPLANSFHTVDQQLELYELQLLACPQCWHTQLSVAVDPTELFCNYLYVSGTSQTGKNHFDWVAKHYSQQLTGSVLDIACNDGSQLDSFSKLGWECWGVDPAKNLFESSSQRHHVICDFWNIETAKQLPKFDLITAQNVFAHTAEIDKFLQACAAVMHDHTILVIQTSQAEMFENNEFDTIYHEHISFFSTASMQAVVNRNGLYLNHVYKTDIHGTSYVFEIGLQHRPTGLVDQFLDQEQSRYCRDFYHNYAEQAMQCLSRLKQHLDQVKSQGYCVVGYGAAAKGMTVINAGQLDLDYIVDDNPLKQGLLCPGSNIPVYSPAVLQNENSTLVIVPLAWNFYTEIVQRCRVLRPQTSDHFVRYFPKLVID